MVSIECAYNNGVSSAVEVRAAGHKSRTFFLGRDRIEEVFLEREGSSRGSQAVVSVSELERSVQKKSTHLQQMAVNALAKEDYESAEHLLLEALDLTPSSPGIYNNLGISYLRRHDLERAVPCFEKAAELAPYDPHIAGSLGMIRWMQGRHAESYQLLDRAVASGFSTPTAHYALGVLALEKGLAQQAVQQLSQSDGKRFRYRDLFLSIALRAVGKPKAAEKRFLDFLLTSPILSLPSTPERSR